MLLQRERNENGEKGIVAGGDQRGGDRAADIVRLADAAQRGLFGEDRFELVVQPATQLSTDSTR